MGSLLRHQAPRGRAAPRVAEVRAALKALANPQRATQALRYFKCGKGEYAEGDRFLGLTVPQQRELARKFRELPVAGAFELLESPLHEHRLTALIILERHFRLGDEDLQRAIVQGYLKRTRWVNNWDLVDSSAPQILGRWTLTRPRAVLWRLVRSRVLWERRIAVLSSLAFIREGQAQEALALCEAVLGDEHDLIHKASGWMLREVGQRVGLEHLRGFLTRHAAVMPRTMLRYSIEKLSRAEQARWRQRV